MALLRQGVRTLRSLCPQLVAPQLATRGFAAADDHDHSPPSTLPSVYDRTVTITVVDLNGIRHTVRGLEGKSLAEALNEHGFPETYFFPNMGFYTQHIPDVHVFVPTEYHDRMPNVDPEGAEGDAIRRMFRDIVQEYQRDSSYFASYIKLTSQLQGMTVGIGPIKPWILHPGWKFGGVHDSRAKQFDKPTIDIWG